VAEIKTAYGEQVFINLIDKKGSQLRIGTTFTQIMDRMRDGLIKYVWFDFHHECRKMKWENLSKLVDQVKDKLHSFDYFMANMQFGMDRREKVNERTT
jgi:hypothetical protein